MAKIKRFLRENIFITILLIVFLVGVLVYGTYETVYALNNADKQESYEQIWNSAKMITVAETDEEEETGPTAIELFLAEGNNMELYGEYLSGTVDFEVLREYNKDVIGYILIPGTMVSYPILQSQDNDYYLRYNIDGSKGYPGCIYAENYNAASLDDPLTILYGHNMRNRSMFGELDLYREEEFRAEHPYVIIYLPEEIRVYEIVVASKYTDEHLLSDSFVKEEDGTYSFYGFDGDEGERFVEEMEAYNAKGAILHTDGITSDDEILAMSTCIGSNMRYIVAAKRII